MMLTLGKAVQPITPDLGTMLVGHLNRNAPAAQKLDNLYAKILMFQYDETRFLLITADLLEFSQEFIAHIKEDIHTTFSIPESHCLLCASHTHTGPPTIRLGHLRPDQGYLQRLHHWLIEGISRAVNSLEPVSLRVGSGRVQHLGINRRTQVGDQVIMRPNPAGPQDDEVLVLRFDNSRGEPVAAIVNAATHPTTLGVDMYVISADYPGRMQRYLETAWHPGCTVAFLQGACGDVRPAIVDHAGHFAEGTEQDIDTLGERLGKTAQKIFDNSREIPVPRFCSGLHRLLFPYRHLPTVQDLRSEIDRYKQEIAHILEMRRLMPENPLYRNSHTDQAALRQEMIAWAEEMMAHQHELTRPGALGDIQVLALSQEIVLVGIPGELFAEIGLRLKQQSPFRFTFICGYSNGSLGYIPSKQAMQEGGYEVEVAYKLYGHPAAFHEDIEEILVREVGLLLNELKSV